MANYFDKGIQVTAGFSLGSKAPLDTRTVVENLSDLDNHIAENRCYEGMEVYVLENKTKYIYNGTTFEEFVSGGDVEKIYTNTPIGTVLSFAGVNPPNGYLLCDGGSYAVADYQDLYDVIGNIYGGDAENFNVPNLIDKFVQGSNTSGTEKEAGLPQVNMTNARTVSAQNATIYAKEGLLQNGQSGYGAGGSQLALNATSVVGLNLHHNDVIGVTVEDTLIANNPIYGNSSTVQPPALTMVYIIKAFYTNEGADSPVELEDNVISHINNRVDSKVSEGMSHLIVVGTEYPTTETCPVGCWYGMYFE